MLWSRFKSCHVGCILLLASAASLAWGSPSGYSVKDYGATGDGVTKDTQAIQRAIDAASEAGGGTIYFPAGTYLSGTLMLRNFITLHLEAGSTLLGSRDIEDFPSTPPEFRSYTENYVHQSLLYGEGLERVTLEGRGAIDGQGTTYNEQPFRARPYLIRLVECRNVRVRDLTMVNSPMWVQHYLACDDLVISGIRVNSFEGVNNDGLDIDSCRNVRVSDCYIHSSDDALVLKSTSGRTCENVTITNCVLSSASQGFKLGTESNGGFRNITMSNCTIRKPGLDEFGRDDAPRGVAAIGLLMLDGGILERINISNITVRGMDSLLFVRVRNRARPFLPDGPKPGVGRARDVHISNIIARDMGPRGADITGLPGHPVENVLISDIDIAIEGGEPAFPPGYAIKEVVEGDPAILLDHATKMYNILPASGFYCRHVKGLRFRNINVGLEKPDKRPALICDDVQDLELDRFIGPGTPDGSPMIVLKDVDRGFITGCAVPEDTKVFLRVEGKSERISVIGNDLSLADTLYEFAEETPENSLYSTDNRIE
ncbi:MAG: glycoside hydrolase family 28 protein [Candidatus Hydrogenedentes bacterium]|nr:glycoside hydrolase family 28 protein [Candidatus Hydrogenedentota bacterium]